jgi:hypothetical protein
MGEYEYMNDEELQGMNDEELTSQYRLLNDCIGAVTERRKTYTLPENKVGLINSITEHQEELRDLVRGGSD